MIHQLLPPRRRHQRDRQPLWSRLFQVSLKEETGFILTSYPRHTEAKRRLVLYDFLQVPGGAERTCGLLAKGLDAPLCVAFQKPGVLDLLTDRPAKVLDLGVRADWPPWRALRCLHAFRYRTAFLADHDWVIYSGFYAPAAVRNHPRGSNLLYCHALPRFAYDLEEHYLQRLPSPARPVFRLFTRGVRAQFAAAVEAMDQVIVNSRNVAQRMRTYLGIQPLVIHPPAVTKGRHWQPQKGYYLSTARLEPLKRVDLIVEAFRQLPEQRLLVASGGSEYERLRTLAANAPNIGFTGWLDDQAMQDLINGCIATLYIPRDEDFGLSPVESMTAGKPVIGVAEGGLLETLIPGETALLLPPDLGVEHLVQAVRDLPPERAEAMRPACERQARHFSAETFLSRMRELIGERP